MRALAAALAALLLAGSPVRGGRSIILFDEFDDRELVLAARDQPAVKAAGVKLDEFKQRLRRLKEQDLVALFGRSQRMPAKTYALPVAEARGLLLSGICHADPALNKNHTDFYVVPGLAALEVYFGIDGETPSAMIVYFPVDKTFPRLGKGNLARRLAWDAGRLARLRAHTEGRLAEVFPWEVDRAELARLHGGDYAVDADRKLRAWVASGQALGYTFRHADGTDNWSWDGPDGRLARRASCAPGSPAVFEWFHPTGGELRKEVFCARTGELLNRRWCRPTGENIRFETEDTWCWYGKDGRPIREEWDDNGDGLPDWYVTAADGIAHVLDRKAREKRRRLELADSWAVHPELIPAESRISDQPDLRIPIRRRARPAGAEERDPWAGDAGRDRAWWAIVAAVGLVVAGAVCYRRRSRAHGK